MNYRIASLLRRHHHIPFLFCFGLVPSTSDRCTKWVTRSHYTEKQEPLACARRAVWGMLYADDAGIVSKSAEGLAKMMTVIVTAFEAAGLTESEKKIDNNALTNTRSDNPRTTARHRSCRPEV